MNNRVVSKSKRQPGPYSTIHSKGWDLQTEIEIGKEGFGHTGKIV